MYWMPQPNKLLTGVKKETARDLFHVACVGGFCFSPHKGSFQPQRGGSVVMEDVKSFNTELLVIGMIAGIHYFEFSADSEMSVPCRQIVISRKHTWCLQRQQEEPPSEVQPERRVKLKSLLNC